MIQSLPLSTHTFRDIRANDLLYIDKTRYLYQLVKQAKGVYFISRPRRFGKSLLTTTLAELLAGNRDLFKGLWIDKSDYNWQSYPVIRLDFSLISSESAEHLEKGINYHLNQIAKQHDITLEGYDYNSNFNNLISQLGERGQVVVLIDEYDKPLLDHLDNLPEARRVQAVLKRFYTLIKGLDSYLRFVFITGVSKFSRVGIFSGLNHLTDLTLRPKFATMLGLTEQEVRDNLHTHVETLAQSVELSVDETYAKIKYWYNGYRFLENVETVYNPFSILHVLDAKRFANFWFETGTPTFLVNLLKQKQFDVQQLEALTVPLILFSTYDIDYLDAVPLLYQTGYLTIKDYDPKRERYTLSYPNREVEDAFLTHLYVGFGEIKDGTFGMSYLYNLVDALVAADLDEFFNTLQTFFANIPYDLQVKQEKYYQTIFYLIFMMIGLQVEAEVKTNRGRIDTVIVLPDHVYLFEFKLDGTAQEALQQISDHEYHQKYQQTARPMTLVGANFDTRERNVTEWKITHS